MTLPAGFQEPPSLPAGRSDSGSDVCSDLGGTERGGVRVAALESGLHRREDFCPHCHRVCTFEEIFRFDAFRMLVCLGCDGEKFIPWTRTNSEVA
jgi:hypothetical protein